MARIGTIQIYDGGFELSLNITSTKQNDTMMRIVETLRPILVEITGIDDTPPTSPPD